MNGGYGGEVGDEVEVVEELDGGCFFGFFGFVELLFDGAISSVGGGEFGFVGVGVGGGSSVVVVRFDERVSDPREGLGLTLAGLVSMVC